MEPADILKKYFGYDSFRPVQEEVIRTILSGQDVLAIMPTGAGKSVCFQVPALALPAGTVVISPLISLMKDQVEALAGEGVPASYVNSTVPPAESIQRLRDLYTGRLKLLYMAPEKLEPSYFTECLRQVPLSFLWWTRRTACPSGGMTSARATAASTISSAPCPGGPWWRPSPRRPRPWWRRT